MSDRNMMPLMAIGETELFHGLYAELAKQGIIALLLGSVCFVLGFALLVVWRRYHSLIELFLQREKENSNTSLAREREHSAELSRMADQHLRDSLKQQENHMLQQHATVQQVMRSFFSVSMTTDEDLES